VHNHPSPEAHDDAIGSRSNNDHATQATQRSGTGQELNLPYASPSEIGVLPTNSARYAVLEEKSPEDDHFQMSGWSDKWYSLSVSQRCRYLTTMCTLWAKVISLTQRLPKSAYRTVRDFLILGGTSFQRSGPTGEWNNHVASDPSRTALELSPTCMVTEASKNSCDDISSARKLYLNHVLSESTRPNQSQQRRKAKPIS
jgi:hypothetical protein